MTDYDHGAISILNYIISRGQKLLDSESITDEKMAIGIALILCVARAKRDNLEDLKNAR